MGVAGYVLLGILLVLATPVAVLLAIVAIQHYWLQERAFRALLQRKGRYVHPRLRKIPDDRLAGTIVVDHAAFNHSRVRYWWVAEDVTTLAPCPPAPAGFFLPSSHAALDPFTRWVFNRFISAESGTAQLVSSEVEKQTSADAIRARFPGCKVVWTYSGAWYWERLKPAPEPLTGAPLSERRPASRCKPVRSCQPGAAMRAAPGEAPGLGPSGEL